MEGSSGLLQLLLDVILFHSINCPCVKYPCLKRYVNTVCSASDEADEILTHFLRFSRAKIYQLTKDIGAH